MSQVRLKWLFTEIFHLDGNVVKYKARLLAREFMQVDGIDYQSAFSPLPARIFLGKERSLRAGRIKRPTKYICEVKTERLEDAMGQWIIMAAIYASQAIELK